MFNEHTNLRILQSYMTFFLLYGTEISRGLVVFCKKCPKIILSIFWPHTINNRELYKIVRESPSSILKNTMKVQQWRWVGQVLRREKDDNCQVTITWTPKARAGVTI